MKTVTKQINTVAIDCCGHDKFYGILLLTPEGYWEKGFLQKREINYMPCSAQVTSGRTWHNYSSSTLQGSLQLMSTSTKLHVYQFDTASELFRWVGEDTVKR